MNDSLIIAAITDYYASLFLPIAQYWVFFEGSLNKSQLPTCSGLQCYVIVMFIDIEAMIKEVAYYFVQEALC